MLFNSGHASSLVIIKWLHFVDNFIHKLKMLKVMHIRSDSIIWIKLKIKLY